MRYLLVALCLCACGKKASEDEVKPVPVEKLSAEQVNNLMVEHCIGCHQGEHARAGVDLTLAGAQVIYKDQLVHVLKENLMPPKKKIDKSVREQVINFLTCSCEDGCSCEGECNCSH